MDMRKWRENRYRVFNEKIDAMKDHPKYASLRKQADDAMFYNEGSGLNCIHAADFIARIEQASVPYIRDWLDGKNQLTWADIEAQKGVVS